MDIKEQILAVMGGRPELAWHPTDFELDATLEEIDAALLELNLEGKVRQPLRNAYFLVLP